MYPHSGEFELAGENLDSDLKPVAVVHVKKMRLEPKKGAPSKPGSDDPLKSFMIVECDDEPTPRPSLAGEPPVQEEASDGPAAREEQKKAHDTDFQSLGELLSSCVLLLLFGSVRVVCLTL